MRNFMIDSVDPIATPPSPLRQAPSGLEKHLRRFKGSRRYFRNALGLLYTQGIHDLAERAGCYWLIDLVGSRQPRHVNRSFQKWEVKVNRDKSALVTVVEDDSEAAKVVQTIPFTDFPLEKFSFYAVDGVMLLRSEY